LLSDEATDISERLACSIDMPVMLLWPLHFMLFHTILSLFICALLLLFDIFNTPLIDFHYATFRRFRHFTIRRFIIFSSPPTPAPLRLCFSPRFAATFAAAMPLLPPLRCHPCRLPRLCAPAAIYAITIASLLSITLSIIFAFIFIFAALPLSCHIIFASQTLP